MLFAPFRRSNQSLLFRVPAGKDNGALWLPPRFQQFADTMHSLKHGGGSAVRVDGSIDPGISVIPCDHPLGRIFSTGNTPNHIPDGAVLVILLEMELYLHRPRTDVIGERQ